jgi:hypothetical protein
MLINASVNSQIFSLGDPVVKGHVAFILEKSPKYKDDWREYSFDSLSRIIEVKYYRDKELLETDFLSYKMFNDTILVITKTNKSRRGISANYLKYYYNSQNKIVRYEYYKENTSIPMIVEQNVRYENDQLKQYDRILIHKDTSVIETCRFDYLKNKIVIKNSDNRNISRETVILKLHKNRNIIDKVIDYNDPECILAGVRTYSRSRRDKYEIKYKYDKMGNWIKSYSITQFWRYKINYREIKYNLLGITPG